MTTFADSFEEKAHGVICLIKYGGQGGTVSKQQLRQVADYLRGGPIRPKLSLPALPRLPPRLPGK